MATNAYLYFPIILETLIERKKGYLSRDDMLHMMLKLGQYTEKIEEIKRLRVPGQGHQRGSI